MIPTDRLSLEELTPDHAPLMFHGLVDPGLYEFTDDAPPPSLDWLRSRYERLATRRSPDGRERWLNWAIRINENDEYAGYVQATISEQGTALLGYVVFAECQGRGYGGEAVAGLLTHLAAREGCSEARASVDPKNARSIALLERLGFEHAHEGELYVRTLTA
jgi:[ribosomal protein S5]-alanine N-acetyltransferase